MRDATRTDHVNKSYSYADGGSVYDPNKDYRLEAPADINAARSMKNFEQSKLLKKALKELRSGK